MNEVQNRQRAIDNANANNQPELAKFLTEAYRQEVDPQVKEFLSTRPGAPPEEEYDYHAMFMKDKIKVDGVEGMNFLPEEGYRRPRSHTVTQTMAKAPGFVGAFWGGVNDLQSFGTMSYDINTDAYQFESGLSRAVAVGLRDATEGLYKETPMAKTAHNVKVALDSTDQRLNTLLANLSDSPYPDAVRSLDLNRDGTMSQLGEELGAEVIEFMGLMLTMRGRPSQSLGSEGAMGMGKMATQVNGSKLRGFTNHVVHLLEQGVEPNALFAEMMYAKNPTNVDPSVNAGPAVAGILEEMGMEGELVEAVRSGDHEIARMSGNFLEGLVFAYALSGMKVLGIDAPAGALKYARGKIAEMRADLAGLQSVMPTSMATPAARGADEHTMNIERGERATGNVTRLPRSSTEAIKASNLGAAGTRGASKEARRVINRFPTDDGWAPIEVNKAKATQDKKGNTKYKVEFKGQNYQFARDNDGKLLKGEAREAAVQEQRGRVVESIRDIVQRAEAGDENAQVIMRQAQWYSSMRKRLRDEYGGMGDVFADLLGATSPNTPVPTNWNFASDILRRYMAGDFDGIMAKFNDHLEAGGTPSNYEGPVIRQESGKLYGMNSTNAMVALVNMWRNIQPGTAPKARNFSGNLIGYSELPTIDVWAARFLNRMADRPRIPPPAEKAVQGKWLNPEEGQIGQDYGFAVDVLGGAADDLDMPADDLQAVAWFAEKELWGNQSWTTKQGEGGSFEQQADKNPLGRSTAGLALGQPDAPPTAEQVHKATKQLTDDLGTETDVLAVKVQPTVGQYMQDTEQALDIEVVAGKDWEPTKLMNRVATLAQETGQDSAFVSRNITDRYQSANARPGAEVYFREATTVEEAQVVLDILRKKGIDGFTFSVDARDSGQVVGIRYQYVPEFDAMYGDLTPDQVDARIDEMEMNIIRVQEEIAKIPNVSHGTISWHDTVVMTSKDYDRFGSKDTEAAGEDGSGVWPQLSVSENVARATGGAEEPNVGTGDVPSTGGDE